MQNGTPYDWRLLPFRKLGQALDRQSGALEELDIEGNEGEADFWVLKGAILFLILWLAGMARRGDLCGKSIRLLSAAFWILLPKEF